MHHIRVAFEDVGHELCVFVGVGGRAVRIEIRARFARPRGRGHDRDQHLDALRLYRAKGYQEIARRPVVKGDWQVDASDWILFVKPL